MENETSEVKVFDLATLTKVKQMLYSLPVKEALIAAIEQEKGNFETWTYPKDMKGIRESVKPGKLIYSTDTTVISSEPARESRIA